MNAQVLFLEGQRSFTKEEKSRIRALISFIFKDTKEMLGIKHTVIFSFFKSGARMDGYTVAGDWIRITLPEKKSSFKELPAYIYHELHHIARSYSEAQNIQNKINLLDMLVAEGMATYFEMQKVKGIPFPHGQYQIKDLRKHFKLLEANLAATNIDYFEWFLGATKKLPYQFGYKMGKYIIDQVFAHNPKITIAQLTKMPTARIWKLSKINLD
ncbi:MAG: hypothetical protein JWO40_222 [Candidatus Doudnabacteria bacterium]|nr:hypothetical protein [Candidatus Doudnabacteria bacterium]